GPYVLADRLLPRRHHHDVLRLRGPHGVARRPRPRALPGRVRPVHGPRRRAQRAAGLGAQRPPGGAQRPPGRGPRPSARPGRPQGRRRSAAVAPGRL
ncbi:MAG: hypothetical protein AVDCRST_MAG20-2442, partial [uncultured Acidimicrobiales bacterium]